MNNRLRERTFQVDRDRSRAAGPERAAPVRETADVQIPAPRERIAQQLRTLAGREPLPEEVLPDQPAPLAAEEPQAETAPETAAEPAPDEEPTAESAPSLEGEVTALQSQAAAPPAPEVTEPEETPAEGVPTEETARPEAPAPEEPVQLEETPTPQPPIPAVPAEGGVEEIAAGEGPLPTTRSDLAAWRAQVMAESAAIQTPSIETASGGAGGLRQAGDGLRARQRGGRGGLARQAGASRRAPPEVTSPPAPSLEEQLVPEAASLVREKSNRTLTPREMPHLVASPLGSMPVLAEQAAAPTPPAAEQTPARTEPTVPRREDRNRRRADRARQSAQEPVEEEAQPQAEANPFLISVPAPQPPPPLPPVAQVAISSVVARLLAEPQQSATRVLEDARRAAYNGVLPEVFPDIGSGELTGLTESFTRELEQVALQAGATREELAELVNQRRQELEQERARQAEALQAEGQQQCTQLQSEAQSELNQISGARQAADQATQQTINLAQTSNDPQIVYQQRDRMRQNLLNTVAQQRVAYDQARQRMEGLLQQAGQEQIAAYQAVATREEREILSASSQPEPLLTPAFPQSSEPAPWEQNQSFSSPWEESVSLASPPMSIAPPAPESGSPIDISRHLEAAETNNWLLERRTAVEEAVRLNIRAATEEADLFKREVTDAGMLGLERIEQWAVDLTGQQESWWENFATSYDAWSELAHAETLAWETARASQTRTAVLLDFNFLNQAQAQYGEQLDQAAIDGIQNLSNEQRAIMRAYYSQDPAARNPITAVAAGIQERISMQRRQGLLDAFNTELNNKPDSDWRGLARLGTAENSAFNAAQIIDNVYDAMFGGITGWGTDEDAIFSALNGLTPIQSQAVRKGYRSEYPGRNLDADLASELSGAELTRAQAQLAGNQAQADAATLREAMHGGITGLGTDEDTIMRTLRNKTPEERERILAEYQRMYHIDLSADLTSELSSHDLERANALVAGDQARADAIAIDQTMHGGLFGLGTDEAGIEAVYTQVREDVAAEAQRHDPPWTTAQVEAEVQRRSYLVERSYNQRYAADYDPTLGSALRQAYQSELSGPELDLANALANNDPIAADAARIANEAQGILYSDDAVINGVLDRTYNRALEEVRRDGQERVRNLEDRARREQWDDYRLAEERRRLDRAFESEAQTLAQQRIHTLENRYNATYSHWSGDTLSGVVSHNMSGADQERARTLLTQGYLTPAQQLYYAMQGLGTDEEAIRRALQGRSASEIEEIRSQYALLSPNESLDRALASELSGRDEFDTHMLMQGEPENEDQEIEQMRERMRYEMDNSSGFLSGDQRNRMVRRWDELEQSYDTLRSTAPDSPDRRRLLADFRQRSSFAQTAVEGYRRQVDSITDTLATAAAITAAIIVIAVASFFTGGAAAGAAPSLLAAAEGATSGAAAASATSSMVVAGIASAAALAASMGTRYAMRGAAYGWEDMGVDLAVGAVDIAASVATAGMGAALLRAGRLAQMASSRSQITRFLARSMAEGAEGLVSSFPSSLTGNLLRDENWRGGNAFENIALGTLMETGISTVASGVMGGIMGGHGQPPGQRPRTGDVLAFRGTPQERLAQWRAFRAENPGASMSEFLSRYDRGVATRLADEAGTRTMQRELRGQLLSQLEPAQRRLLGRTPIDVLSEADFARLTRGQTGPLAMITEGGRLRMLVREGTDPRMLRQEGQALSRQVVRGVDGAPVDIRRALPRDLRSRVPVTIVPGLPGNTVRVYPIIDRATGLIRGVGMVAGPGASQLDLMLHARTARLMQRYGGLLGGAIKLANRVRTAAGMREIPMPRSLAWELRLEVDKLPRIIRSRVRQLSQEGLSPSMRRSLMEDITNLQRQLNDHTSTLRAIEQNPALGRAPGRGYVAAEGLARPPRRDALAEADDLIRETAQANPVFRSMVSRAQASPDLFAEDSLRRIFALSRDSVNTEQLGGRLNQLLSAIERGKDTGVSFSRMRQVIDGLANSDATQRSNAHFLLERMTAGGGKLPALENTEQILRRFSLEDIHAIRDMHTGPRFAGMDQNELFNAMGDLSRRVEGKPADLLRLVREAGENARRGAPDPDLLRLSRILADMPTGKVTPQQVREAIRAENRLIADLASSGNRLVQRLFRDLGDVPLDAQNRRLVSQSASHLVHENGVFSESAVTRFFRKRAEGIAGAIVDATGAYDRNRWRLVERAIRETDLPTGLKNNIIGEMGEQVRRRMLEQTRNSGDRIVPQLWARARGSTDWARIDHGILSVRDKTIRVRLEDVKTGGAKMTAAQSAVHQVTTGLPTPPPAGRRLEPVLFDEDQIFQALGISNRSGYRIVVDGPMGIFTP